jgi:hypothetical protein
MTDKKDASAGNPLSERVFCVSEGKDLQLFFDTAFRPFSHSDRS